MDYLYDHIKLLTVYYSENQLYKKLSWLFPKIYDLLQILLMGFFYMKFGMLLRVLTTYIKNEIKKKTLWSEINYETSVCAICLDKIKQPVRFNCGHLFCYQCVIFLLIHMGKTGVSCPICRSSIRLVEGTPQFALSQKDVTSLRIALHSYNYYANFKKIIKIMFLILLAMIFVSTQIIFIKDNIINL